MDERGSYGRSRGEDSGTNGSRKRANTMATTETEYKEIVRRVSTEAWGGSNFDVIDEYFDGDFVSHNPVEDVRGPAAYKEFISMFRSAFPDLEVSIEDQIAEGNKVVDRHAVKGTHEGELMGIEATGTEVEVDGIVIVRFDDGKIVEEWAQADMMGLMEQLGAIERPAE